MSDWENDGMGGLSPLVRALVGAEKLSEWEGSLKERNDRALKRWAVAWGLCQHHNIVLPDARAPVERDYFDFSQARKLEAARSFLDRVKYLKAYARRRGFHHVFT